MRSALSLFHVSHCLRLCLFWRQVIIGEKAMALKAALRMFKIERKTRVTACLFYDVQLLLDFKRRIHQNK